MSLGIASPEGSATPGGSGRRRPSGVGGHAYSTPRPLPWTTSRGALLPGGWNFPAYYFSTTPDVTQHDWFVHSKLQSIKDLHLMDSISIPGFAHLPSTMPSDLLEDRPSMPALNKLVAVETPKAGPGDEKVHVLSMPETIIKTWYQHPTCSESLNWIRRLRSVFFYVFVVF